MKNLFIYLGFIVLGVILYLDFGKHVWGVNSEEEGRLVWYGIGCGILIFGLIYNKLKSSRF